ncbi:MAG: gamma carbonic anhydrase family protein [Terrisporobacter othiniensis]|uniref:gamma carbonic anhydrase family protein n=1 Tax=Terrisporobacter petrolearius TaxID=1460447 RepID=UPI0022E19673|nr:gamma carbonic anhydrase family protein [Terrisporobacter petrolearius]MDU4861374.1 gamma carbonic anhydrase family protein [Terrisporobacter othiniensis]MDU6994677.1 gamma carbonic anhydrase family protein [Terrisporobacter othiniensis]
MIKGFEGIKPTIDESVFVAETADIIGDVIVEKNASIWYKAVLRGDDSKIIVGENSNVQDGTIVHCGYDEPTIIGKNVTIGHAAVIHGCKIGDYSLIGMGSIVLDNAEIGELTMVGAGSLVTGKKFPPGVLLLGSPAKVARELTDEEKESLKQSALHYVEMGRKHK